MRAGGSAMGENPSEAKRRAKREAPGRTFRGAGELLPDRIRAPQEEVADQDERNLNLHVLPKWRDRGFYDAAPG